jgi:putative MFS transporter
MSSQAGLLKSLDESAFTSEHRRIYSIALFGHLCDGFDINVMGFVLPSIIASFHLTGASAGFLASAVFFGMFFGAGGGGLLADIIGRKKTIILAMLIYGVASVFAAAASTYWTLWIVRLVEGIGLGAEVILIFSYVVEFLPVKNRGALTSSTVFFWQISSFIAAGIAILVIPYYGWRWMFVIGGVVALIAAGAWMTLPESVRFLIHKGRLKEAQGIVKKIGGVPVTEIVAAEERQPQAPPLSSLLGRAYRKQTLSVWAMQFLNGFVFFGIAVWLPTLFLKMGFSFVHSLLFTGIITGSGAVGNVIGGLLLDRWGRRPTLIVYSIAGGLALASWGLSASAASVIIIGAIGAFFSFGVAGPLFTYVSEIYPTALRASGVGIAGSWQRIGGVVAPYVLGIFVEANVSVSLIFGFVGALMITCGIIAWWAAIETKLESLEHIQTEVVVTT